MKLDELSLSKIIDFDDISKLFYHFSVTTGFDIVLYDAFGNKQLSYRLNDSICQMVQDRTQCVKKIIYAAEKSKELGEPYIFEGSCGLVLCSIPIVFSDILLGSIVCGPVMLWDADELANKEFEEKTKELFNNNFDISKIPQTSCESLTSAINILLILINHLSKQVAQCMEQKIELIKVQKQLAKLDVERETTKISVRKLENKTNFAKYPVELEKELIAYVQMGERQKATGMLNSFLSEIFSYAGGDINLIKTRLYEFNAFLSRATVEVGVPLSSITDAIKKSAKLLEPNLEYVDLCILSTDILNSFLTCIYENKENTAIGKYLIGAIQFINSNYKENLTLTNVATEVGVNSYYLSHLFKDEMKITFYEYLSKVRLDKAKELIRISNISNEKIAELVGFSDVGSFSKAFKKRINITPAQYKKLWK